MRRDIRICIRCTPSEKSAIDRRARAIDYTTASFLREFGQCGAVQPIPSINQIQWAKLSGLGSNLNQLVHLAHSGTVSDDLLPTLEELQGLLIAVRADLVLKRSLP